jgi:acetylornithine deacetylase/succinyl-diaminopimelate desuccinylase-like protein
MEHWQPLVKAVDGAWVADQAQVLVEIPSVTLQEQAVCRCYERQLRDLGLEVDVRAVSPGRDNLYARIRGTGGGPALVLNGHLDTIPNQTNQPCRRDGDRLYGRGSTDMKGGMAALLGAARALLATGVRLRGDLWLTAVVGHEEPEADKDGPKALIEDLNNGRLVGDRILIAEGRDALWIMSMGSMVFTITLDSDRGGLHTQYVPFKENPIRHLGDLIRRVHDFQQELDADPGHPLAGPERIDLGIARAGDYFNRTAPRCTLVGTRRWAPGRTAPQVLAQLRALAEPFARAGGLTLDVRMEHNREPFETPVEDPVIRAAATAHRLVTGTPPEYVGLRIVGDANLYVHGSGVPTFYYGPSNETAHADVEWVSLRRVESAAQVYALTAALYCGVAK